MNGQLLKILNFKQVLIQQCFDFRNDLLPDRVQGGRTFDEVGHKYFHCVVGVDSRGVRQP